MNYSTATLSPRYRIIITLRLSTYLINTKRGFTLRASKAKLDSVSIVSLGVYKVLNRPNKEN